jgi:multiple sugar transport system ATP-binding protein
MAGITIDKLTKYFDSGRAVDNISLKIKDGEFFVFVGPSGCGKSTLLRLIAGLITPTSGDIKFDERIVTGLETRERNVAMVFQSYALYPHKNVYENIAFGLRARKTPKDEVDKRVKKAATMLGIQRLLNRWPKELSGGERQRVAIGRAIVRHPEVYLLDEPLSNLDAKLRIEMRNELAKIHRQVRTTFIYVTHDQVEAMTLGDRIAVLNEGKIEQIATPEHLYDFPVNRFVAEFIGSPPMNFIRGRFSYQDKTGNAGILIHDSLIKLEGHFPEDPKIENGSKIILGIRPESVNISSSPDFPLEIEVTRVEPIGHEGFIYFELFGSKLVARVSDWQKFRGAKRLYVGMNINHVYLFLPEGRCIWGKGRKFWNSE